MYPPQRSSPPPLLPSRAGDRSCTLRLLSALAKSIVALSVALAISALILWLVYRPHKIKISVDDASLRRFDLTPDRDVLRFNLAANMTIRNPNEKIGIYYDWLESDACYGGARFGWCTLRPFYQGSENTTVLRAAFAGQSSYINKDLNEFRQENATGLFNINLWLHCRVKYKFGSLVTRSHMTRVKCGLALRLVSNSTNDEQFTSTMCDVVDF